MLSNRSLIGRMLAINSLSDRNLEVMALANTGITSLCLLSIHSSVCLFSVRFSTIKHKEVKVEYLKENGELKVSRAWNLGITCLCFVSVHLSVFVYFHFPPVWTAAEWWRSCFSNPCFLCSLLPPVFDLSFDSRRRKHKENLQFSFSNLLLVFCSGDSLSQKNHPFLCNLVTTPLHIFYDI